MNTSTQEALKMAIDELEKGEGWMDNVNETIQFCKEALAQSDKNTLYLPVKIDKHGFIFNMQPLFDAGIQGKFKIKLEVCDE